MSDSGWKLLVEKLGEQLDKVEALVNGLIAGNSVTLLKIEHRLTALEEQAPKCPDGCQAKLGELRREIERKEQRQDIQTDTNRMEVPAPPAAPSPSRWARFTAGVTLRDLLIWSAVIIVAVSVALGMKECLPVLLDWISKRL